MLKQRYVLVVVFGFAAWVTAGGPIAAETSSGRVSEADWPMWQYDAARSADPPLELAKDLHLQWMRQLPDPDPAWPSQNDDRGKLDFDRSYSPVVMGQKVFVPSNVTDSVTAYHLEDGSEQWRVYTNGPVRLAPVAWRDRVFFTSDDGCLYCVDAENGRLNWKFRGGPSEHRLLGNERIINFWAARGGPVIKDETIYFAAGLWPLHGIFIYALDAQTGRIKWVNDRTSSDYVKLPHGGATGFGGLSPQGYLAADEDWLVVAGGRGLPALLNRHSGESKESETFRAKPNGGYAVHVDTSRDIEKQTCLGKQDNPMLNDHVQGVSDQINGEVFDVIAARGRLLVTTENGTLYCFGPDERAAKRHDYEPAELAPRGHRWQTVATRLLKQLGETEGYALVLGAGSGDLFRELALRSQMHIVVVEDNPVQVRELRDELSQTGMSGRRAAVIEADPATFSVQPYLFSLVVSEDAGKAGLNDTETMSRMLKLLRPYGGLAYMGSATCPEKELASLEIDQVSVRVHHGNLFAKRGGPLTGAGQWTHQYQDPAHTLLSKDKRVRLPLGVLWFGGPDNDNVLPRHARGPKPQVSGGRQVFLGVDSIAARCVYTGRKLWQREFPGIGHPFTNLGLERTWSTGQSVYMTNIPGASLIGSPFVTLPDSVYLRHQGSIYRLNPENGKTLNRFHPSGGAVESMSDHANVPDWGHISVNGDYLIATSEPYMFKDQKLGWNDSYSGTSSRRLVVMDRYSGEVVWDREASTGFRHGTIVSGDHTLYIIDGLSDQALNYLARRGQKPQHSSTLLAFDLHTGTEQWRVADGVFGTYLQYSRQHDILLESGNQDIRGGREGEPRKVSARRGGDGKIIWRHDDFDLPGAIKGEMLISGTANTAISLLTGQPWKFRHPRRGKRSEWQCKRRKGCSLMNASENLLLFRSGYAAYFDLENESGTGFLSGVKSGCTANLIPADGVVNAIDYTRTCTCSYPMQTSLALIHMPNDPNIEFWTCYVGAPPNPEGHGLNFGAPGRRVDVSGAGIVWHNREGSYRHHPSAVSVGPGGIAWVAASGSEMTGENKVIEIEGLLDNRYTVRLHFAELEKHVKPGERVFDVLVDSEKVLSSFDIMAETGQAMTGTVKEFSIEVKNNKLTVEFHQPENSALPPLINGIELAIDRSVDMQ